MPCLQLQHPKPPLCFAKHVKDFSITWRLPCKSLLLSSKYSPWVNGGSIYIYETLYCSPPLPCLQQGFLCLRIWLSITLSWFYTNISTEVEREWFTQDKRKTLKMTSDWYFFFTCLFCQSEAIFLRFLLCWHIHHANSGFQVHSFQSYMWGVTQLRRDLGLSFKAADSCDQLWLIQSASLRLGVWGSYPSSSWENGAWDQSVIWYLSISRASGSCII